jgi:hypothetical protein
MKPKTETKAETETVERNAREVTKRAINSMTKHNKMTCPNCTPIGNREDANSQADRNSTLSRPLRHTGRITMNKDEMIENVARSVAVRARPNHGGTGTCICVDCENIKYGVRWGYREGFDAAQAPLLTALRELVEAVEDGLSFDETDFGEFNHLFKDEIAALTKAKALLPKGE